MDDTRPVALAQVPVPTWREIPLTQGYVAIVDEADYERVAAFKWCAVVQKRIHAGERVYATRANPARPGKASLRMHRWLIDAPPGMEVDHRNGNSLDNQRENLRLATRSQNMCNFIRRRAAKSSRFRGVSRAKRGKWQCKIVVNGRNTWLGLFADETEAAIAYDRAAVEHHGAFALLNFPAVK